MMIGISFNRENYKWFCHSWHWIHDRWSFLTFFSFFHIEAWLLFLYAFVQLWFPTASPYSNILSAIHLLQKRQNIPLTMLEMKLMILCYKWIIYEWKLGPSVSFSTKPAVSVQLRFCFHLQQRKGKERCHGLFNCQLNVTDCGIMQNIMQPAVGICFHSDQREH